MSSFKRDRPTIGVLPAWSPLIGDTPDRYLESIVMGIQAAARAKECHLLLAWGIRQQVEATDLFPAWPVVAPETDFVPVSSLNTDGLIVLAPLLEATRSNYIRELRVQGFPVLFVATGEDGPTIAAGNEEGIRQAVAHLVGHGHQRIAFIAGDPLDKGDSEFRLRAYLAAVAEYALSRDPRLVVSGWHNYLGGYSALKQLLDSRVGFTAVVVSDDNSAIGAMRAIREAGLAIPRDIAVIGFDDQPEAAAQVPPLASVHVPLREIGQQAVLLMLDHLDGKHALESIRIPTRLVPRQSCGCLPAAALSAAEAEPRLKPVPHCPAETDSMHAQAIQLHVVTEMLAALPSEARIPEHERTQHLCHGLIESFSASLQDAKPVRFQMALMEFLQEIELRDVNMDIWQEIISILRREMKQLPLEWQRADIGPLAEDMLHQARVAISESAERRDQRHQFQRDAKAYLLGVLTSRLSATLDAQDVAQVLNGNLADVGIRHARIAIFEAEGDDPVAWSIMPEHELESPMRRFATREFPPPGLYQPNELLNLALLPLLFQNEALGYIAFDGNDLSSCASIARQVAAALKTASLHGQVVELSLTDPLTGLHNRRYFDLFLKNEVIRSQRFAHALAIIMLDVDGFKTHNDLYGHPAGDVILQKVAGCLLEGRRSADVTARLGGDEFAIILPETNVTGALHVSSKIHTALANLTGLPHPLTVSIGVTALPIVQATPEVLVKQADQALYNAKRSGRDQACIVLEEKTP